MNSITFQAQQENGVQGRMCMCGGVWPDMLHSTLRIKKLQTSFFDVLHGSWNVFTNKCMSLHYQPNLIRYNHFNTTVIKRAINSIIQHLRGDICKGTNASVDSSHHEQRPIQTCFQQHLSDELCSQCYI